MALKTSLKKKESTQPLKIETKMSSELAEAWALPTTQDSAAERTGCEQKREVRKQGVFWEREEAAGHHGVRCCGHDHTAVKRTERHFLPISVQSSSSVTHSYQLMAERTPRKPTKLPRSIFRAWAHKQNKISLQIFCTRHVHWYLRQVCVYIYYICTRLRFGSSLQ